MTTSAKEERQANRERSANVKVGDAVRFGKVVGLVFEIYAPVRSQIDPTEQRRRFTVRIGNHLATFCWDDEITGVLSAGL